MMAWFRAFAKSWVAMVLMGTLVVAFAIWGVRDVFHTSISDDVVKAGSRTVDSAEFKRVFDNALKTAQQQSGQTVTAQDAVAAGLDRRLLQQMMDYEALLDVVTKSGVQVSNQLIVAELRKTPAFFNPVSGAFDKNAYEGVLQEQLKTTPALYEKDMADRIALSQFSSGLTAGLRAPRVYSALYAAVGLENRSADYFTLDHTAVPAPVQPTEAQLVAFLKSYGDKLRQPEMRQVSMVRFSAAALAQTLPADPAEVQKQFDYEKSRLSVPEKRAFVQIPAKDAQQAAVIAARLAKGEDATAIARSYGVKPISYPEAARASVADPAVAAAVFALAPGKSSGPIQGEFGFAVAKLASITPAKPATLDDVRSQIEGEIKSKAAQDKVFEQVQKYDDVHATGAPLAQAAKAAGVQVYPMPPITAEGQMPNRQTVQGMNAKMVADAFSLAQGGETEVQDLGKGEYYALRVEKVIPSAIPSLEQIRAPLTQEFMRQDLSKRLQARADLLIARLHKGETLQSVAASVNAKPQQVQNLTRANGEAESKTLGQEFVTKLFQANRADVFTAGGPELSIVIAKVSAITQGALPLLARATETQRPALTQRMGQDEIEQMLYAAARARVKPRVDEALARKAIGVAPDDASAAGGKPALPAQ